MLKTSEMSSQNGSKESFVTEDGKYFFDIFKMFLCVVASLGLIGNGILIVILIVMIKLEFISSNGILMLHIEAINDFCLAGLSLFYIFSGGNMLPNTRNEFEFVRVSLCYVIHSQWIYWTLNSTSVYNDALLSIERYSAIVKPFRHEEFRKKIQVFIVIQYIFHFFLNFPVMFYALYDIEMHECAYRSLENITIYYKIFAVVWIVDGVLTPLLIQFIFNFITVKTLLKTNKTLAKH